MPATGPAVSPALAAVLTLALAGCAARSPKMNLDPLLAETGPPPSAWTETREARAGIDLHWIERFDDRRLTELVAEALATNPDLRASASRVRRAVQVAEAAGADMRPQAGLNLGGERRKSAFIGFPFGAPEGGEGGGGSEVLSSIFNTYGASLDVSWEIDVWGRIRSGQSAAIAESEAAYQNDRAARASLAAQVAKAWFALIEANEQEDLARETVATFEQTEEVIRDRFASGSGDPGVSTELRLALSDVAAARARRENTGQIQRQAVRQLELLLGRYPSGTLGAARQLPGAPPRPPAGLPSELLLRRPDILAAEREFAASIMRVQEARRAVYPRLALTASAGTSTEGLQQLLDSDFGVWSLGANVAQSILTGGVLRAEQKIRSEDETQALAEFQRVVLAAFGEVENALAAEAYLARREAALTEAAELAGEADREARADYRGGTGDFLTVLAARNRALEARSSLISVRRLRLENRLNLHLALGGDYRPRAAKQPSRP